MRLLRFLFVLTWPCIWVCGCVGVRPYEKEYLLSPLMDDEALQSLNSDFRGGVIAPFERLSNVGTGGGAGSSCPTCGG